MTASGEPPAGPRLKAEGRYWPVPRRMWTDCGACTGDGWLYGAVSGRIGCAHCDAGEEWVRLNGGRFCCLLDSDDDGTLFRPAFDAPAVANEAER